jgi:hypothetical protein
MGALCFSLMTPPKYRPFEDAFNRELSLSEFEGEAPDFLDGLSDDALPVLCFVLVVPQAVV